MSVMTDIKRRSFIRRAPAALLALFGVGVASASPAEEEVVRLRKHAAVMEARLEEEAIEIYRLADLLDSCEAELAEWKVYEIDAYTAGGEAVKRLTEARSLLRRSARKLNVCCATHDLGDRSAGETISIIEAIGAFTGSGQ